MNLRKVLIHESAWAGLPHDPDKLAGVLKAAATEPCADLSVVQVKQNGTIFEVYVTSVEFAKETCFCRATAWFLPGLTHREVTP